METHRAAVDPFRSSPRPALPARSRELIGFVRKRRLLISPVGRPLGSSRAAVRPITRAAHSGSSGRSRDPARLASFCATLEAAKLRPAIPSLVKIRSTVRIVASFGATDWLRFASQPCLFMFEARRTTGEAGQSRRIPIIGASSGIRTFPIPCPVARRGFPSVRTALSKNCRKRIPYLYIIVRVVWFVL
jgi:hypothetical protein